MKEVRCLVFFSSFLWACSPTLTPLESQKMASCVCPSLTTQNFQIEREYWESVASQSYPQDWEMYFNQIEKQWNYLNVDPIDNTSVDGYRLTTYPPFTPGWSERLYAKGDSVAGRIHFPDKEVVVIGDFTISRLSWPDLEKAMDSLFWNQPFESLNPQPVSDGTAYYIEGYRNGEYKMIGRASINMREEHAELFSYFTNIGGFPGEKCSPKKMGCQ
ncbi:MAG: hypothetical protein RIE86_20640 [Imperialibacter sp.]|uniref:hypothetical protein n=1 Tax=Imperialibacter sp. TaxID=2038411 RepID=UPI0032F00CCC